MFTVSIPASRTFSALTIAAQHNLSGVSYRYHHLEKEKVKAVKLRSIKLSKSEFSESDIENLVNSINEALED